MLDTKKIISVLWRATLHSLEFFILFLLLSNFIAMALSVCGAGIVSLLNEERYFTEGVRNMYIYVSVALMPMLVLVTMLTFVTDLFDKEFYSSTKYESVFFNKDIVFSLIGSAKGVLYSLFLVIIVLFVYASPAILLEGTNNIYIKILAIIGTVGNLLILIMRFLLSDKLR